LETFKSVKFSGSLCRAESDYKNITEVRKHPSTDAGTDWKWPATSHAVTVLASGSYLFKISRAPVFIRLLLYTE